MLFQINDIVIVCGNGPDVVLMTSSLPSGVYPYTGNQEMKMDVAAGDGEKYVKKHFPNVPYRVVNKTK